MHLSLLTSPRALILSSGTGYVLAFRPPPPELDNKVANVVVELLVASEVDLSGAVLLNSRISGCLGVMRMAGDTFLVMISSSTPVSNLQRPFNGVGTEPISKIITADFFCLTSALYDAQASLAYSSTDSFEASSAAAALAGRAEPIEHPCAGVRKIISNGNFYYSSGQNAFDLSTRLEGRLARERRGDAEKDVEKSELLDNGVEDEYDPRFLWNTFIVSPLLAFRASLPASARAILDQQGFIVLAIQGYCGIYDINLGGQPAVLSLISRLGSKRAGTRFNTRGIDDDGSVANFVETETVLRTATMCMSYVQIRGSVPLFWEEAGVQPFGLKITITRPVEASLPAFLRHFESLLTEYSRIHIVNLLSSKDQEANLTDSYTDYLAAASLVNDDIRENVRISQFDFHARSRIGGIESIKTQLADEIGGVHEQFGGCLVDVDLDGKGTLLVGQRGVFRTNCKDCLDRTNVVEDVLSRFALEDFIRNACPAWSGSDFSLWNSHRVLFAENGDSLSNIYVGTGALNTSFTRSGKKSFAGLLSDATKSVGRMYQSNFVDSGKQKAIDALLGNLSSSQKIRVFNPLNDAVHSTLMDRATSYTSYETISIWVGTYNLNGKGPSTESLLPWLFPTPGLEPTFLVITFQEIVPLTPQMIMATDPDQLRRWEAHILATVAARPGKKAEYIILRSGQLVGTAMIILCQRSVVEEVRNIEASTKKTGLKGMAGNKGAVAIRMDFRDTSFCFVTAHLAAGASNVDERNEDYTTIADGLHFRRGKSLSSHENVIWAADTNYRISLPNDVVRYLCEKDDYAALQAADQLGQSMKTRKAFVGFTEGPLLFRPTYKYDNGLQTYDTSEKQRIPSWTDRILYKGPSLDLSRYQRAELLTSDHRPVYAILRAQIRSVNRTEKALIRKEILGEIVAHSPQRDLPSPLTRKRDSSAFGNLPPPSSDEIAWWDSVGGLVDLDSPKSTSNPSSTNPFDAPTTVTPVVTPPVVAVVSASKPPSIPTKPVLLNSTAPVVRRKPPTIPIPAASIAFDDDLDDLVTTARTAPPPPPRPSALLDQLSSVSLDD